MKRNSLAFAAAIALTVAVLASVASGGPGDSEPITPSPHVIVHAPASVAASATQCDVWAHSHHMYCGAATDLSANSTPLTILSYAQWDMGEGSWDEKFVVDLVPLGLQSGGTINWLAQTFDFCDYSTYTGTATTNVE